MEGEVNVDGPTILNPVPDLLLPNTYNAPDALTLFQCIENELPRDVNARPSRGHIASATRMDAQEWGTPVSVWPLGENLSYVWRRDQRLFYPGTSCPDLDELAINTQLSTALRLGKEVLFASSFQVIDNSQQAVLGNRSPFLAFPMAYDNDLLLILSKGKTL